LSTQDELIDVKEQQLAASIEVTPKPAKNAATPIKKVPKRAAQTEKSRPVKRQKKEEDESEVEPSEVSEDEESSPVSEFDDSDISDAPKPKKNTNSKPNAKAKAPPKRQTKKKAKVESDEEDETSESLSDVESSDAASTPPKKATKSKGPKKQKFVNAEDSHVDSEEEKSAQKKGSDSKNLKSKNTVVDSDAESNEEKPVKKSESPEKTKSQPKQKVSGDGEDSKPHTKAHDSDSSEMSVVLDEAPKTKKRKSQPSSTKPTSSKEPPKEVTTNEALIKTLQSQLVKCGVRKIWAFELKSYGSDEKGKIRHLQDMLREIGMTGRFSEGKAREIKELRELQADLESGRRARGVRKSLKESSGDDEDEDDAEEDGGEKDERPSKAARAKLEFAFLGDEESDSD
jgi:hypothetical protein